MRISHGLPLCAECSHPVAEPWQIRCDWCEEERLLALCNCFHDERDECICYDGCPKYDRCPGFWKEYAGGVELVDQVLKADGEVASQGRDSEGPPGP